MTHKELTSLWSRLIVDELVRNGIRLFCISPGSRSTPLTVAAARHPETVCRVFPDERASAFFALGQARATHLPAVLVCTSGTAAANYFPAVVEASMDRQPLIVLSADRPAELQETGANQTIRQQGMYGSYTRWNFQLPEPSEDFPARALVSAIDEAAASSTGYPPGPVHINIPFREPLDPVDVPPFQHWTAPLETWLEHRKPWCTTISETPGLPVETAGILADLVGNASSPLVIAGNLDRREDALGVYEMARTLAIPLYADISSQLRLKQDTLPLQLAWLSETYLAQNRPDLVLHFGGPVVGKKPAEALEIWKPDNYIVVRNHPFRYNPSHNATMSIEARPGELAGKLQLSVTRKTGFAAEATWLAPVQRELDRICRPELPVSEISAARLLSSVIDPTHGLFLANSMPVRDMDMYGATHQPSVLATAVNRGASGIDGLVATAAGFAQGRHSPVTIMIGDISLLHDLNSLHLLSAADIAVTVIAVNNNGGGIFSFLPVSDHPDVFENFFATPRDFSIRAAAETFGLRYSRPETNSEFCSVFRKMSHSGTSGIIEIRTSRHENLEQHRMLNARLARIIEEAL
ncbi:MAG: 2-succinyl-5-enolpyruvyl-6-hydroxy-3-cyclohexene-1-carboxylic-acid synthase [Prosthecochloris sp.]|nr:2-succinyl-5-enolpyruvyl-6-hydroxy-3-cyclohexene-1-carboxylic-acid synthase [Prosthecochloris sp.]